MNGFSEGDWGLLIQSINRNRCILLLGPNAAMDPNDPSRPLTQNLAAALSLKLENSEQMVSDRDLAHVAELYYREKVDRYGLEKEVAQFYDQYKNATTDAFRNLAALPFTLCLSTTHDCLFENAIAMENKSPVLGHYNFRSHTGFPHFEPTEENPFIYKLYGSLEDGDSLVITESDLLDFLSNVIRKSPPIPDLIASKFADKGVSFLFIGFGFQQWHLRIQLNILRAEKHDNRSIALENQEFFDHPEQEKTVVYYDDKVHLNFRNLPLDDFAARLRKMYESQVGVDPAAVELPETAPKAFLCYNSEDRAAVEKLGVLLHQSGINTWRDKQNLRGGDDWNRQIQNVIQKQVDYVLVIQTPNMLNEKISYCYKEIKTAKEHWDNFREDINFIIPCLLGTVTGLEELSNLHNIDVGSHDGFQSLVEAVFDDWARR